MKSNRVGSKPFMAFFIKRLNEIKVITNTEFPENKHKKIIIDTLQQGGLCVLFNFEKIREFKILNYAKINPIRINDSMI